MAGPSHILIPAIAREGRALPQGPGPTHAGTDLSILAHELRQPLAVLSAVVEVLLRQGGVDKNLEIAAIARRQILQLTRLLDDLPKETDTSLGLLVDAPNRPLRMDARALLEGAASDAASAAFGGGQFLTLDTGSEPMWIDGDRQRLQQVLSNLINNAIHYSAPGGQISLSLAQTALAVTIRVTDTGRGLAQQDIPAMFDLFWRGNRAGSAGFGIGLSVVRDIVESHHGRIEARSRGLGHGSEFIITLPAGALEIDIATAPGILALLPLHTS